MKEIKLNLNILATFELATPKPAKVSADPNNPPVEAFKAEAAAEIAALVKSWVAAETEAKVQNPDVVDVNE